MRLKMKEKNTSGILITFCGLDGSGKTTMISKLCEMLSDNGEQYVLTKQPTSAVRKSEIFRNYQDSANHEGIQLQKYVTSCRKRQTAAWKLLY